MKRDIADLVLDCWERQDLKNLELVESSNLHTDTEIVKYGRIVTYKDDSKVVDLITEGNKHYYFKM